MGGKQKCRALIHLNLSWYEFKIDYYNYKMFYVNFMVTTKQKPVMNTQKIKESKHTITENHHKKGARQEGTKELQIIESQETISKMAIVSPNLSIITLNINRLSYSMKDIE